MDLLQRKADKERAEQELRNSRTRENVKQLSEEERLRRIQQMQQDAEVNDTSRMGRLQAYDHQQSTLVEDRSGKAEFIDSMRKDVYSGSATGGSIKDRLDQNKHYRQSTADMEQGGYRKN